MSTTELKYGLHQIIESINDSKTLQAIFTLLSAKTSSTTITGAEKAAVDAAIKSFSKGDTLPHKQVMSEMKKKYPKLVK